jgi:glycosyltransferase involved in cell wall biosynthesis
MEVSVVMPCLNAARTIRTQLDALSGQEWKGSWEVIVADNGSTDGTRDIVASYSGRLPGLKLIDASECRGAAHARNVGARAACGESIVFCDADDEAGAGWLAAMANALRQHDFVANRMDFGKLNSVFVTGSGHGPQGSGLQKVAYPPYLLHAGGSGLGVKRALNEAVDGFDESLPQLQDTDYCFRLQLRGVELHFVPDAIMHVRYSSEARALFRQRRRWGKFNVLLYKRYRREMTLPHAWRNHLWAWRSLILTVPQVLHKETRTKWMRALGWQVGLLQGSILYRVPPVK